MEIESIAIPDHMPHNNDTLFVFHDKVEAATEVIGATLDRAADDQTEMHHHICPPTSTSSSSSSFSSRSR